MSVSIYRISASYSTGFKERHIGNFLIRGISAVAGLHYRETQEFIKKKISPGGSADLLAVTIMLYLLENPKSILF